MEKTYEITRIKQVREETEEKYTIRQPDEAAEIAVSFIGDDDREVLLVMCLNTKNDVVAVHRAHVGALNQAVIHPREIYKACILSNSASLIIAHQHPSNDPSPSPQDIEVTRRISEAGKILGIELLDSLVVTDDVHNYRSLKEDGYI